jgi:tetratricopeptide (TPR) repeat protein
VYHRALSLVLATRGEDSVETATLYHNLGGLEHARGRYALGEPHARRGLAIREKLLGPDHQAVAADAAALAAILDGQASATRRRFGRVYGSDHYEVAVNLNNLAALRQAGGDAREAEELYRRALALKEKLRGANHPDVAVTANNLAVLYKHQGRYADAERLYRRALTIFECSFGVSHPKAIACRENLAASVRASTQDQ